MVPEPGSAGVKIKRGVWVNGKRAEWKEEISDKDYKDQMNLY